MQAPINCNKDQEEKLYRKHLRWPVFFLSYSYDNEDHIGFVSFNSIFGKKFEYQLRSGKPMFMSMTSAYTDLRFDINYPKGKILKRLTELGLKAEKKFWKGGDI